MFLWIIIGFDPVITKLFARGMGITLCSSRKFVLNTMSNSSILTIAKWVRPIKVPNLMRVFFATPKTGKAVKLMIFIFPTSWCQRIFNHFALVSVMELWVALESPVVFLVTLWLTQTSTYIKLQSISSVVSSTLFWKGRQYVPFHPQVADIFTKSVSRPLFELFRSKFYVRSSSMINL